MYVYYIYILYIDYTYIYDYIYILIITSYCAFVCTNRMALMAGPQLLGVGNHKGNGYPESENLFSKSKWNPPQSNQPVTPGDYFDP